MLPSVDIDRYFQDFMNSIGLNKEAKELLCEKYISQLREDQKDSFIRNTEKLAKCMKVPHQIIQMVETLFKIDEDKRKDILEAYDLCMATYTSNDDNSYILLSKLAAILDKTERDDVVSCAKQLFSADMRPYYRGLLITILSGIKPEEERAEFISNALKFDITGDMDGVSRVVKIQELLKISRTVTTTIPPARISMS